MMTGVLLAIVQELHWEALSFFLGRSTNGPCSSCEVPVRLNKSNKKKFAAARPGHPGQRTHPSIFQPMLL